MSQLALKSAVLASTSIAFYITTTPPTSPPPPPSASPAQRRDTDKRVNFINPCSASFMKFLVVIATMSDLFATLSVFSAAQPSKSYLCPSVPKQASILWTVHPIMMFGALATLLGTAWRVWCFKTMGQFFMIPVAVLPKHQLIDKGPYALMRHPSYTGMYFNLIGTTMVLCAPGTWLVECGVFKMGGFVILGLWLFICLTIFKVMSLRVKAEDNLLKETFGSKWEDYARRVPYTLLPGIL